MNTIYKRTSTGATQEWTILVDKDSFWTISGQVDGAKVVSSKTYCKGKNIGKSNETTPENQALLEAQAKYTKKLESGYKENVDNIDQQDYFKPMLAKEYKDYKDKIKFPVSSSAKIDGARLIARKEGLFSRNGKPYISIPHISKALKPVFEEFPKLILDGELYNHQLKNEFNEIMSLIRQTKPTEEDLRKSKELIEFHVFEYSYSDGIILNHFERKCRLKGLISEINHPQIKFVENKICHAQEELDACYADYLLEGYEGQMVNLDSPYQNKRSNFLLKRKEFQDKEYKIAGVVEGVGNRTGCAIFVLESGDQTFNSNIKGQVEYTQEIFRNRESYIGKLATIKFQNLTPDGVPRFGVCIAVRNYE